MIVHHSVSHFLPFKTIGGRGEGRGNLSLYSHFLNETKTVPIQQMIHPGDQSFSELEISLKISMFRPTTLSLRENPLHTKSRTSKGYSSSLSRQVSVLAHA